MEAAPEPPRLLPPAREGPEDEADLPPSFRCCLSGAAMSDPVVAADGRSYERSAIAGWLASGHAHSPATGEALEHAELTPAVALRTAIRELRRAAASASDASPPDAAAPCHVVRCPNHEVRPRAAIAAAAGAAGAAAAGAAGARRLPRCLCPAMLVPCPFVRVGCVAVMPCGEIPRHVALDFGLHTELIVECGAAKRLARWEGVLRTREMIEDTCGGQESLLASAERARVAAAAEPPRGALLRAIEAQQQQLRVALAAAHTEMLEQASEQSVQLQLRLATQSAALAEADGRLQGASAAMLAASAGSKADTARAAELTS